MFAKDAPKSINATIIGLYYLSFFAANSMVGWIGGFLEKWPTTNFWLLHAAFAAGAGLCFVLFKFLVSRRLEVQAVLFGLGAIATRLRILLAATSGRSFHPRSKIKEQPVVVER